MSLPINSLQICLQNPSQSLKSSASPTLLGCTLEGGVITCVSIFPYLFLFHSRPFCLCMCFFHLPLFTTETVQHLLLCKLIDTQWYPCHRSHHPIHPSTLCCSYTVC